MGELRSIGFCDLILQILEHTISLFPHALLTFMYFLNIVALPASTSFLFASTLTVLTFAAMQMFKGQLAATKWMTILGGFVGSQLFVFLLTVSSYFIKVN